MLEILAVLGVTCVVYVLVQRLALDTRFVLGSVGVLGMVFVLLMEGDWRFALFFTVLFLSLFHTEYKKQDKPALG